ncbi:hypothetical protein CASFOL_029040 [Castilleja foliolosa]|uniref:F-box domain-containing protein n=1 Tax=Castilleja foliolosa TaxID=1961234 RepID=A0ABD3CG70_9LAMI
MDNIPPSIIRQPPPPLTPAGRKEGKTNPEMVGSDNRITRTNYLRSCTRKRLTDIESLPDEVLFNVLLRLPAQDIYDSTRLVCIKWCNMAHTHTFINAHLQHSTHELIFQSTSSYLIIMSVGESGLVEISKHSYKPSVLTMASCNGLLLEVEFQVRKKCNLYVSNPTTGQVFSLPLFFGYMINNGLFGIAYAAATMEYKAVVLFTPAQSMKKIFIILTIGVDNSWRTIGSESVSLAATQISVSAPALMTEGFVHFCLIDSNEVLTLNVETEIITDTSGPIPKGRNRNQLNTYLSTGRYLSLLRPCGEFCWEVWEMKPKIDYRWRKVWDISLETHKCSTCQLFGFNEYSYLIPIGWLKYLELLVFSVSDDDPIFVFNLLTREIVTFELPFSCNNYNILMHKNSLVWLDGC